MPWLPKGLRRKSAIEASVVAAPARLSITASVNIQAAKDGEEDSLPRFSIHGYTGNPMRLAGWRHPVVLELSGLKAEREDIPALRAHSDDRLVGHCESIRCDLSTGMHFEGIVSGTGPDAQEVRSTSKNGVRWQASIGADPVAGSVKLLASGKTTVVNGRTITGPHYIVGAAIVSEISFVPRGADGATSAAIAAQYEESDMNFEQWIAAQGFDVAALTDKQRTTLQAAYDAEQTPGDDGADHAKITAAATGVDIKAMVAAATQDAVKAAISETVKQIKAEEDHKRNLAGILAGHPELAVKAQAENWSTDKAELEVERANRPRPIFASTGVEGAPDSGQVIQAALCVNAGLDEASLAKDFDEKVINAAMGSRLRGFGVHALMHEVIRASGRSIAPGMANDSFIRMAFEADQQIKASGVSTLSLTTALGDVVNKFIVAGINNVDQSWRQIAAVGSVKDFRTTTGVRLTGDFKYLKLGQDGEIKHAAMSETTYTNRAETFARMFAFTRQDFINDDLGNLEASARLRLGRGAGKAMNDAIWAEFMDNSTFFTAARGNYDEDIDTALAIAGLTLAEALFRNQTDEDGDPAEIEPAILLVPNALRTTADQLMGGFPFYPTTPGATNPWAGKFKVVSTPYLSNANYTGNSSTAWYLLADPNTMGVGVIQVVFLNGKQVPTVESAELDFNTLGMQMRGYLDFGVALQEYRAGVKMEGVNV
jgi:phage major head subunit gpT-like protein